MSLAEESDARKARLIALRNKKLGQGEDIPAILSNRNFDPETRTFKKRTNVDQEMQDTVEKVVEGVSEKIQAEDEERRAQELDLLNIAPRRPNWDLKREMEKRMSKLERKTQEAIHVLIRQRLAAEKGQTDDIAGAMTAEENAAGGDLSSDEE